MMVEAEVHPQAGLVSIQGLHPKLDSLVQDVVSTGRGHARRQVALSPELRASGLHGLNYGFVVTARMRTRFEWDPDKAGANRRKHGVSFETAVRAFADPFALTAQDRIEGGEVRWQTLGLVEGHLLLLVAHTVRDEDEEGQAVEVIRIISARKADRAERRRYEEDPR